MALLSLAAGGLGEKATNASWHPGVGVLQQLDNIISSTSQYLPTLHMPTLIIYPGAISIIVFSYLLPGRCADTWP